jgi:hypothetical protein
MQGHVVFLLYWIEIASKGSNTFCHALLSFGDTVRKHALISIEPVLEGNSGESKMKFDIIKEVILVSWKKQVAVVIYGVDFEFFLDSLYAVTAGLMVAMNYCIADSPNKVPLFWRFTCCVDLVFVSNHPEVVTIWY